MSSRHVPHATYTVSMAVFEEGNMKTLNKSKAFRKYSVAAVFGAMAMAGTAQAQDLRVAWYGGNWGDAFQSCIADPFTKADRKSVV